MNDEPRRRRFAMWRIQKRVRRLLHLREPWKTTRREPNRYPEGSWRWLAFDRFSPIHYAGEMLPKGGGWKTPSPDDDHQPGEVLYYGLNNWASALHRKFPKAWRWQMKHLLWHYRRCACSYRPWSPWRAKGVILDCKRHGFAKTMPEMWARVQAMRDEPA